MLSLRFPLLCQAMAWRHGSVSEDSLTIDQCDKVRAMELLSKEV
jgi:hypothetical protein